MGLSIILIERLWRFRLPQQSDYGTLTSQIILVHFAARHPGAAEYLLSVAANFSQ